MEEYPFLSAAISQSIEIIRKSKRITKTSLAELAGMERKYLREIVQCRKRPTVNAIYSICGALRISPVEFFSKVEEERQKLETQK